LDFFSTFAVYLFSLADQIPFAGAAPAYWRRAILRHGSRSFTLSNGFIESFEYGHFLRTSHFPQVETFPTSHPEF
jgi:hypothetical protein